MKNQDRQLLIHIIGCIAFLSLPVLLSPDVSWELRFLYKPQFWSSFLRYFLLLCFFYLNYFILIPRLHFQKKYWLYAACIIASFALTFFVPFAMIATHRPDFAGSIPGDNNHFRMPSGSGVGPPPGFRFRWLSPGSPVFELFFQFIIVWVLSLLLRINNRLKQAEKQKVSAELSYLKAQINPHFLFNTLNGIYSLAIMENAEQTATATVKLSGMMRYVISDTHQEFVPLEKEFAYIRDYIDLQKIRLGDTVQMVVDISGNVAGKKIAPLLLIPFIENAFKYGVNPEQTSSIEISIHIEGQLLNMQVSNSKVQTRHLGNEGNNIGVTNTRSRLMLAYPFRHELNIEQNDTNFTVSLKIDLT